MGGKNEQKDFDRKPVRPAAHPANDRVTHFGQEPQPDHALKPRLRPEHTGEGPLHRQPHAGQPRQAHDIHTPPGRFKDLHHPGPAGFR